MLHAAGSLNDGFERSTYSSQGSHRSDRPAVSEAAKPVRRTPPTVAEFEAHNLLRM
jgi:hypothetical protein